jgi:hypothetical protein
VGDGEAEGLLMTEEVLAADNPSDLSQEARGEAEKPLH